MNLDKLVNFFKEKNLSRQERLFRVIILFGIIGLSGCIISGLFIGANIGNVFVAFLGLLLFAVLGYYSISRGKIQLGASVMGAFMLICILPLNFLTSGGTKGGAHVWFLAAMVFVCLVVEGRIKYILLAGGFVLM